MKTFRHLMLFVSLLFAANAAFSQGSTNSAITGKVTTADGEPLVGVNVLAVHTPTGSRYGAVTDLDGFYRISNMRSGGPYSISISYLGYREFKLEGETLPLGVTTRINAELQEEASALDEVVITATTDRTFDSNKTGAETYISQRDINRLPQTSRSIADFVRTTPQVQLREGDDGFSISIAGQNNRYNAIYIDGAVNNDVFGLAGSGTNGGQTGVSPFSVDAIESFQVQLAPYDVKIGGFSGGAISAVTRSGTNQWQGSTYYFYRNEDLAGKTPSGLVNEGDSRERLAEFTAETYGVRIGGPIIENKLFFFANYEREELETPQPFNFSNYQGDATRADIDNLIGFVRNNFGYEMGGFENNTRTLESDKFTLKLDWNLNERHKLSLSGRYVEADNLEARNSSNSFLGFANGSEAFVSETTSISTEWGYQGDTFSNNMVIGYTRVRDDRDPAGNPFPTVVIRDGGGSMEFGAERFSTANLLDQDIFTFTNNFEIYKGAHTITLGTHNEYADVKNLFLASNFGTYTFSSINDFVTGQPALFYERGFSLLPGSGVGDDSSGAAEFELWQLGLYAQDDIQVSDNFRMSIGLRFDMPIWEDGLANDDFNNRTIPLLEAAGKDLQGARVGQGIDNKVHVSPRLGFNWDVFGNKTTQVRGGLGVFTSRMPLVWPGATYNNNGVTGGFSSERDFDGPIFFNPDVNNQPTSVEPGTGAVAGNVDLFAKDFKLPQRFRTSIAVDQKLPIWGLVLSADYMYNDNISDIFYENLNIRGPVGFLNGSDTRPFFNRRDRIDATYGSIILASNTSKGYSWNSTFTLRKPYQNGFQGQVSWSFGRAEAIFDGTSSQNTSQWRNIQTVNGKNSFLPVTISDFNQGHRITSFVSYDFEWLKNFKTTIGLFYEGFEGTPFSYIYNNRRVNLLNDDSRDNALMFVPGSLNQINLVDGNGAPITDVNHPDWVLLNNFIENDSYLRSKRGQYVERNGDQGPWSHIIDLRLVQDFKLKLGNNNHAFQFTADIFNFTNFLNKDWGKRKFVPGNVSILQTESGGPDPTFSIIRSTLERGVVQLDDAGIASSRWQMQLGLRYLFN